MNQQGPHGIPEYIELLTIEDKELYEKLQKIVGSPNYRYNRNHRLDTLNDLFSEIRDYCEHDDNESEKWKRYLICGICWFQDYIAINTKQLRLLISKSKSSINGALAKMGYQTVSLRGEQASLLLEKIPFLFGHYREFRKWSIRKIKSNDQKRNKKEKSGRKEQIDGQNIKKISKNEIRCTNKDDNYYDELFKDMEWSDESNANNNKVCNESEFCFVNFNNNFDEKFDNFDFDFEFDPYSIQNFLNSRKEIDNVYSYDNNNYRSDEVTIIC